MMIAQRWSVSGEKPMSHTDPLPSVCFAKNASWTNVPSLRNTWTRSFVRSQMPLVRAGGRVERDDAVVYVSVGGVQLVRRFVHDPVRRHGEIRRVVAAAALLALSLVPDLQQEFSRARELQELRRHSRRRRPPTRCPWHPRRCRARADDGA